MNKEVAEIISDVICGSRISISSSKREMGLWRCMRQMGKRELWSGKVKGYRRGKVALTGAVKTIFACESPMAWIMVGVRMGYVLRSGKTKWLLKVARVWIWVRVRRVGKGASLVGITIVGVGFRNVRL
ncbi:unnamed protein product [Prunus armeniaca]|uniref:Uncharacterized protein n=1 Tax=Prunus armeniaca TaxID=36596 RepID=A0A6J5U912_PRUAR|nr:unnamed protein product [Prunus armeniaca]